ncbi:MAG: valine--tRNA ligase [Proteobacteria bacterium]|nr:valine--tRNA ligase [Pseudomonadota bacterium]
MKALPERYDHKESEARWQKTWVEQKTYAWKNDKSRDQTFVIDTPPPTVSGILHMGHIFSYTQADFVARYQRMKGKDVFYPMGFDDNGLPTERLVEKEKKIRATDFIKEKGREGFIALCQEVVKDAEEEFRRLFKSVALSVDWDQEYQTISEESRKISQMSFLDLFHKNEAYRKLQPMLWDPVDQTAIAQAEVVDKELPSAENYIVFGLVDKKTGAKAGDVLIMTTRPELLPACVAVMCDPSDEHKYTNFDAMTPLFGVRVPIIADEKVDKEKGTGVVMCCTFGDETDIHWWKKHNLNTKIVLNKYGKLDEVALVDALKDGDASLIAEIKNKKCYNPDPKNFGARETLLAKLKEAGLLKEQKPITHAVKCAERSGAPLEILPTHQWFVKVLDKKEALKAKTNACEWFPEFMKLRCEQWIDGLSWDWCISRQRYFGVPFPVWYSKRSGEEGKILVPDIDQLPVNPIKDLPKGYTKDEVEPDMDVMDTWATSSVSPQLSAGGINKDYMTPRGAKDNRFAKLFPADMRPQAHEIIRTWAFYTIVKAHLHENAIPWKNLMISGWCLAADKTKMSKSKGNVITPVDLIESKGSDAVRYWASTSRLGADTAFSEDVLKIGNKLVTKLWNATKFASIQFSHLKSEPSSAAEEVKSGIITETLDKWILSRLSETIHKADTEFARFEYCDARVAIDDFFWKDFCDNYLEMVKIRAYGGEGISEKAQMSAVHTVYHCVEAILRLYAPFVPHITEELYSHIFDAKHAKVKSIHARGNWPDAKHYPVDVIARDAGILSVEVLETVRRLKAEKNVSLKWPLTELRIRGNEALLKGAAEDLRQVTNAAKIVVAEGELSVDADFAAESDQKTAEA